MPSTLPDITELSDQEALDLTKDGYAGKRHFSVIATSLAHAYSKLAAIGIVRGVVYADQYGQIIDPGVTLDNFNGATISPAPVGGSGLYRITANYSRVNASNALTPQPGGSPVYTWEVTETSVQCDHDKDFNPLLNSFGKRPKNPPTIFVPKIALLVKWYVTSYSPATLLSVSRAVNSGTWTIPAGDITARQAKCMGVNPQPAGLNLYLMQGRWEIDPDTWDIAWWDEDAQGNYLDGNGNRVDGKPPADPSLLPWNGGSMPSYITKTKVPLTGTIAAHTLLGVRLSARYYDEVDFHSVLGI